jgi:branched-chain amino acid transport system substrate-binding protein
MPRRHGSGTTSGAATVIRIGAAALTLVLTAALAACGVTGSGQSGSGPVVVVGVDLPFQGPAGATSTEVWNALRLYLDRQGGKAGRFTVRLAQYDDSTAARNTWDPAACTANAKQHVAATAEVAVLGLPNAGCLKVAAPILDASTATAMLTVTHAVTDPGLTTSWGPDEPAAYAPSGVRAVARVVPTDDVQALAAARYAGGELKVRRCLVLNNGERYGVGLAHVFVGEARRLGVDVAGEVTWDRARTSYTDLLSPFAGRGVDCVYLAGNYDDNGGQLIADKVSVLGDNTAVRLLAPDGFAGYPELSSRGEARGAYVTLVGLPAATLSQLPGAPADLRGAYQAAYSAPMASAGTSYAVLALQVVLAAIATSDGTRAGVRSAVFGGSGVGVPADVSAIGKAVHVNPGTGDVDVRDVTLLTVGDNQESLVTTVSVG